MLQSLTCTDMSLENWRSRIRHFVQAHDQYADVQRFTGPETADITYVDTGHRLEDFFCSRSLGDVFPGWAPSWLGQTAERRCQVCFLARCACGSLLTSLAGAGMAL